MSDATLPLWAQVGGAVATAIVGVAVAIKGYLPKKATETAGHGGRDAVVLSAAIADSAAIRELATAVKDLTAHLKREAEISEHRERLLRSSLETFTSETEHLHKAIRNLGERTIL